MSIRILPPPVRTQPFFDGDFRLQTAIALDEEGSTPPLAFVLRLVAQPLGADEEIAQAINLGGDDAQIFTSSSYGLSAAVSFAADDELPQFIKVDEDGQLVLRTILGSAVLQPATDDGSGPISAIVALDEDGQLILRAYPTVLGAQPAIDDEVGVALKNFGLDDDALAWLVVLASQVIAQPGSDDGTAPQFVITVLDEDGQFTVRVYSAPVASQPFADDEVGAQLKNFGLDDEIQPQLSIQAARSYPQPLIDDDLPQITVTVVDEDGSIILFATNRGPYQLPMWADNELAIAPIGVDEDGYAPIIAPLAAAYAFRQSADDELSIAVTAVIEEDGSVAIAARWSAPFAQPVMSDETSGLLAQFALHEDPQAPWLPNWPTAIVFTAPDEAAGTALISSFLIGGPRYIITRLRPRRWTVSCNTFATSDVKSPDESVKLTFDFSPDLPTGVTLVGNPIVTFTVVSGSDANPSAVSNGTALPNQASTAIIVPVDAGLDGVDYKIHVMCATSDPQLILSLSGILPVRA